MNDTVMERTLVILKPDAVQRQLVGRLIQRFEEKGLKLAGLKLARISDKLAQQQYEAHRGKYFYEPLVRYMTAGPVVMMVWEGRGAIAVVRAMMGPTFGPNAPGGTIRGDFGMSNRFNLVHGSDSVEAAAREIALFFTQDELVEYDLAAMGWIYDTSTGEVV